MLQHLHNLLYFGPTQGSQCPADTRIVRPARLSPGFCNRYILVKWMRRQADILQILRTTQNRHQKFDHFRLGRVLVHFLTELDRFQPGEQSNLPGKMSPGNQERMLGFLCLSHVYSCLLKWLKRTSSLFSW